MAHYETGSFENIEKYPLEQKKEEINKMIDREIFEIEEKIKLIKSRIKQVRWLEKG